MPVLPRTAWTDGACVDVSIFDPLLHLLRYELGTVVAFDRGPFPVQFNELIKYANNIERREMTRALDPKCSSGELIDHG